LRTKARKKIMAGENSDTGDLVVGKRPSKFLEKGEKKEGLAKAKSTLGGASRGNRFRCVLELGNEEVRRWRGGSTQKKKSKERILPKGQGGEE